MIPSSLNIALSHIQSIRSIYKIRTRKFNNRGYATELNCRHVCAHRNKFELHFKDS